MTHRVCVASSFPEAGNRNVSIVSDLAHGFRAALGAENAYVLPYPGLANQLSRLKPTLLVLVGSALRAEWDYAEIARICRMTGTIFAFWTVEDPYEFDTHYRFSDHADLVFSNDAWACRFYDRDRVFHLPTAASERIARSLDGYAQRALEVFFCGVGFPNRCTLINDALPLLERRRTLITGENWPPHPGGVLTNRRLSHADLIEHYAASRCVLNMGRTFAYANKRRSLPAVTPGPRTFEAAMVGCVQLYYRPSQFLGEYFSISSEMVTFDTVEELDAKLAQLLADPGAACAIARAAQTRALTNHTYTARALTILAHAGLQAAQPPEAREKHRKSPQRAHAAQNPALPTHVDAYPGEADARRETAVSTRS
jgi:spore maturation protein CgeB